jgi:hypothetical protein
MARALEAKRLERVEVEEVSPKMAAIVLTGVDDRSAGFYDTPNIHLSGHQSFQ